MTRPLDVLAALAQKAPALELGPADILFLTALALRAEDSGATTFEERELLEVFREVSALTETPAQNLKKRATHTLARLREQRLLVRVDGAGLLRTGQYALSRLATAIVAFYVDEDTLTGESLALLSEGLLSALNTVVLAARSASSAEELESAVVGPLRVTVSELTEGIARRQRALDLKQEDFQRQVAALLRADWFGAVERCESLLEGTSGTLRELNQVLLRDTQRIQETLEELREIVRDADVAAAEGAVEHVSREVDRIAEWGADRQRAWSEYHQYVHRFLRDVVRLDPTRTLSERLRAELVGEGGRRYALLVANEPPITLLREDTVPSERPQVRRQKKPRETEPLAELTEDPDAELERSVRRALEDGARGLAEVTELVTRELAEEERFVAAGRIAAIVARISRAEGQHERPWVPVSDAFQIEEWAVLPKLEGE